jgi:hypothetical protein
VIAERIAKFVKKKISINGVLINFSLAVSPLIFFIQPFPEAGLKVPFNYLTDIKKKTGRP